MSGSLLLLGLLALGAGFGIGWITRQFVGQSKFAKASLLARQIIEDAKAESEGRRKEILLEAKEDVFQLRQEFENEAKSKAHEFQRSEKQLSIRELNLDRKVDILSSKEKQLNQKAQSLTDRGNSLKKRAEELETMVSEENIRLEKISGLTAEEAKNIQMQNMLEKAKNESTHIIREVRQQAKQDAIRDAREIIIQAVQRSSISHVVDSTVSIIELPNDEMKGRIIGREGRNIRAFESATGVEVLIDDTPNMVVLSGFDPMRREIAKQSLEKLLYDGRIHPGRIEEVVEKTGEEMNDKVIEIGEQTMADVGLHGLHIELIRLLGKQNFRISCGQNLLQHSKEVAILSGQLASLLGLDINLAKRAGLLHDIGKVAEGFGDNHPVELGVELVKKFGEGEILQNAIAEQSPDNREVISPIAILVSVADGISVSRPGAQKEMLESHIQRMTKLEDLANSFNGVTKSYAIQAGRELRVMVEHSLVDDNKAQVLADDLVEKLNDEMEFPGQIKVTVIREYRSIDYAR